MKPKPSTLVGIVVILAALGYLIFSGLGKNLVYFITPSEYFQDEAKYLGKSVRLGGLVKAKTINYNKDTLELKFILTDGVREIPIESTGTPPALFGENKGVVVEGRFSGQTFLGTNLLAKHSEEYSVPKEGYTPEDVKKIIQDAK